MRAEYQFLIGLLRRLPKLCAVTVSAHNSYNRVTRLKTLVRGDLGVPKLWYRFTMGALPSRRGRLGVAVCGRFDRHILDTWSLLLGRDDGSAPREGAALEELLAIINLELSQRKHTKTDVGA